MPSLLVTESYSQDEIDTDKERKLFKISRCQRTKGETFLLGLLIGKNLFSISKFYVKLNKHTKQKIFGMPMKNY